MIVRTMGRLELEQYSDSALPWRVILSGKVDLDSLEVLSWES